MLRIVTNRFGVAGAENPMTLDTNTPATADAADHDIVLTQPDAARMMCMSTRTLERLVETGEAPPRINLTSRRVGYWRSDVMAWLKARTSPAKQAA